MRAAIYARKSNDDDNKGQDNKSVTRQVAHAKAYAVKNGWTVDDEHIYVDDGISGTEYVKRSGLQRLLSELNQFDVVVASENSRIGRDQYGNSYVFKKFKENDVQLFFYLSDEQLKYDTAIDQFMANVESFASQMERERIAQRTRDALERKAKEGYSAGGRCYGYENVWVFNDGSRKLAPTKTVKSEDVHHTEQEINEDEARIVRGVFKMYLDGFGHTVIAKTLNGEEKREHLSKRYFGNERPDSPQNGTNSWSPSAIRAMLYRKRYFGIVEYGAVKNKQNKDPISIEILELRIIEKPLWDKVQKRLEAVKATYLKTFDGRFEGRPEVGRESKYLLSSMGKCGCGGSLTITGGQKHSHYYYGCSYNQNRGMEVCSNNHRARMNDMDSAVIKIIKDTILTPDAIEYVIKKAQKLEAERRKQSPNEVPRLEKEKRKLEKEMGRFMSLIATGDAPDSVLKEIKQREKRLGDLDKELTKFSSLKTGASELELRRFRKYAEKSMSDFNGLLTGNVLKARQALRKILRDDKGNFSPLLISPIDHEGRKTLGFRGQILPSYIFNNVGAEKRT